MSTRKSNRHLGGLRIDRRRSSSASAFERAANSLRTELLAAQYTLRDSPHGAIVLLSGPDREAVLEFTARLTEWLDARLLDIVSRAETGAEERARPYFWRYATRVGARGRIAVVPFGWAQDALVARLAPKHARKSGAASPADIVRFERQFTSSGTLLVKLWFHLDDADLAARRARDRDDPRAPWDPDRRAAKSFPRLARTDADEAAILRATDSRAAPWRVLAAADDESRDLAAGRWLRDRLRAHLTRPAPPPRIAQAKRRISDRLRDLAHPREIADLDYDRTLDELQGRLNQRAKKAYRKDRATVLVFEGPDAAGKGGAIRRVTNAIRAPVFDVVPISAPTEEDRRHHWLWRFWRQLPRDGRITIFDRSWYGRVLVERVERFAPEHDWRRAYEEIRDFERWLREHGVTLVKFWLEVSPTEQARRFTARATVPFKKYKLTPDDFRNRAKRPAYEAAANEMFAQTGTRDSVWHVLRADDKKAVRLEVLRTVLAAMGDPRAAGTRS